MSEAQENNPKSDEDGGMDDRCEDMYEDTGSLRRERSRPLRALREFESAGMERKQAEVFVEYLEMLATKTDVKKLDLKIEQVKVELEKVKGSVKETELRLRLEIERSKNWIITWVVGTAIALAALIHFHF